MVSSPFSTNLVTLSLRISKTFINSQLGQPALGPQNLLQYLSRNDRDSGLSFLTKNVYHFPEKCRADPDLFGNVYCSTRAFKRLKLMLHQHRPQAQNRVSSNLNRQIDLGRGTSHKICRNTGNFGLGIKIRCRFRKQMFLERKCKELHW